MRRFASVLACGFAMALVGCGDSHDKVTADSLDVISDMNDVLDGVNDKASAEAAKPELEALGERMQDIKARAEKLGEPSAEQKQALEEKYKERMGKEVGRIFGNMMRVGMNPEIAGVLDDAMNKLEPPGTLDIGGGGEAGGMEIPIGETPEMTEPFEGAENPFGGDNPFGAEGDAPAFPAEPQPPATDDPE